MFTIRKVEIENLAAFERLPEISPGKLTIAAGPNASGKSSLLRIVKSAIVGGTHADLLHDGKEQGSVVLQLHDDETDETLLVRRSVNQNGQSKTIRQDKRGGAKYGQTILDEMFDVCALDPVQFINAKGTEQVAILLRASPVEVDAETFQSIGIGDAQQRAQADPLDFFKRVEKDAFEERTNHNRTVRHLQETIETLRSSLPKGSEDQVEAELTEARHKLRERLDERDNETVVAQHRSTHSKTKAESDYRIAREVAEREYQRAVDAAREARDKAFEEANEKLHSATHELASQLAAKQDEIAAKYGPDIEKLKESVATLTERHEAQKRVSAVREKIVYFEGELSKAASLAARSDAKLETIRAQRSRSLGGLPYPGLEIRDDGLYLDDRPWSSVNTAKQIEVALSIADGLPGSLVLIDGIECLDKKNRSKLVDFAINKSKKQFLVTAVDARWPALKITTGDNAESFAEFVATEDK